MSKTILVEWPGLLFSNSEHILQNAAKFYPPKNVSSMQLQPSRQPASGQLPGPFTIIESGNFFMPAWVTGSLPPACSSSCCWLGWAAQNAGNHVHKLLRVLFTLLRECLPTSPSTKNQMGLSCSSTHALRGAAREFGGAVMDFFLKDAGAWCIPDQEPCSLPEGPAHHAVANLQHRGIFSAHFWNFEEHAPVTIFQSCRRPRVLEIIPDKQQGTSDLVSLFELRLVSWCQTWQPPHVLTIIPQGHWCSSTWLPMSSWGEGLAGNVEHASHREALLRQAHSNDLRFYVSANGGICQVTFDDCWIFACPVGADGSLPMHCFSPLPHSSLSTAKVQKHTSITSTSFFQDHLGFTHEERSIGAVGQRHRRTLLQGVFLFACNGPGSWAGPFWFGLGGPGPGPDPFGLACGAWVLGRTLLVWLGGPGSWAGPFWFGLGGPGPGPDRLIRLINLTVIRMLI